MADDLYEEFHKNTSRQTRLIDSNNFTYWLLIRVLSKYLINSTSVLDIGCGAGTISLYIASKGNSVLGIDISRKAIESANKSVRSLKLNNIHFEVKKFPLELPKEKFDLILCLEVLEHIKDEELALKSIYRLLNKSGVGVFSVPSKNAPLYKLGLAKEFDKRVGHLRRYTIEELTLKCRKVGFKVVETKKTEGIVRNFLFLNNTAGQFIRVINKFKLSRIITLLDNLSLRAFGESDIYVIVRKP